MSERASISIYPCFLAMASSRRAFARLAAASLAIDSHCGLAAVSMLMMRASALIHRACALNHVGVPARQKSRFSHCAWVSLYGASSGI